MINVTTGFGYFANSKGEIAFKALLPKGCHPTKQGYNYSEVASRADLDLIEVKKTVRTQAQIEEKLIINKMRQMAIEALKADGVDLSDGVPDDIETEKTLLQRLIDFFKG